MNKRRELTKNDGYYFPMFNLKGMRSSITPYFGGDLKLDYHHYALEPTTEVDLYNNIFSRNVIFDIEGKFYFLNGQTGLQQHDRLVYETDLLYQKVTRTSNRFSIETTSYVALNENLELHEIFFTNISKKAFSLQVTTAIPIYARSADNLRDHRQVTSLLNQVESVDHGILVKPTLSFDERGHIQNETIYSVFAHSDDLKVKGYILTLDDFIQGGSLHFPKGLNQVVPAGTKVDGYEAMGAIQFEKLTIAPNQTIKFIFSIGIHDDRKQAINERQDYAKPGHFEEGLKSSSDFFKAYTDGLQFSFFNQETSKQLSWVVLQPMLRRYFGNSYLPHHDYGHGGRGWRDLWQDLLALIMMNDDSVYELLYNNFQGVRIDGSNATIIGDAPGEFKADRNMITRVWSDHGAWPLITTKMYIDETGDLEFLLKKQNYFTDQFTHYTKQTRMKPDSNILKDRQNEDYRGTVLEHLLLQNLVGHHNIGDHGFVKLEDADWNDGLDMAHHKGETIAFTHMYANNLRLLADLIRKLPTSNIVLFEEMLLLLEPNAHLDQFFDQVADFKGDRIWIDQFVLAKKLDQLAKDRIQHLNEYAFLDDHYQSYFDDEGKNPDTEQTMNLTGQAIVLLSETPLKKQARVLAAKTKKMLFEKQIGGYHLNSNYHQLLSKMGRAYGFAYGHKENGAVFSHMVIMYAYGLYQYNLINLGREAMITLMLQAQNPKSKVWLGIPEYFTDRGIGMYPYLTGSASWLLKLMRTQIFGISMDLGKLTLNPKLRHYDFIDGKAFITTYVFKKQRTITYINPKNLDYGQYVIEKIMINGKAHDNGMSHLDGDIEVYLNEKI